MNKKGDYPAAIDDLLHAIVAEPDRSHYKEELGQAYYGNDEYEKALRALDQGIAQADPKDAELRARFFNARAVTLGALDREDEALPEILQALDLAPQNEAYHRNYGRSLIGLGRIDEADAVFTRLLAQNPNDVYSQYEMARVQFERGNIDAATEFYTASVNNGIAAKAINKRDSLDIIMFGRKLRKANRLAE